MAEKKIEVPKMVRENISVALKAISGLISHQFSEKVKKELADKMAKKASAGRQAKDPIAEFVHSLYFMVDVDKTKIIKKLHDAEIKIGDDVSKFFEDIPLGFPASGFKGAAVSACRNVSDVPMTLARGAFHIKADIGNLVEVQYEKLIFREDNVRVGRGAADLRYRGEFADWSVVLDIILNPAALSAEQVCNLIDISGFSVGIGDWRPEKDGSYGMFELAR